MGDIIKFQLNVPVEVPGLRLLNGNFGKLVDSPKFKKGDGVTPQQQYQFSTVNDCVFWVPDFAGMQIHDQLAKLGVHEGDPIKVTKAEIPQPGKKPITRWLVERIGPAPSAQAPAPSSNGNSYHPPAVARKVSYGVFLREAIRETVAALKENGEQWSDASKQGMVSTLLIQAGRDGIISWNLENGNKPDAPIAVSAEPSPLEKQLAASIALQKQKAQQPAQLTGEPAAALQDAQTSQTSSTSSQSTTKPWRTFGEMVRCFEGLKSQIPWPIYYDVLKHFGAEHANQFENAKAAWACYQRLDQRVREHLHKAQDPTTFEHFEAVEGDWQ
jgi:hypothetical protein